MKKIYIFLYLLSGWFAVSIIHAQDLAVFIPQSEFDNENSYYYAGFNMAEVSGLSYLMTSSMNTAIQSKMILISMSTDARLSNAEIDSLKNYIYRGGIVFSGATTQTSLLPLFGIEQVNAATTRYRIKWTMSSDFPELEWFDDPLEKEISLASLDRSESIRTRSLYLDGAVSMAVFDDMSCAVSKYNYGNGVAYMIGCTFHNLITLPLINKHYDANRFRTGFEPSSDVIMLFLRGIFTANNKTTVWKHTSPGNTKACLIPTHDMDGTTAFDSIFYYAGYEKNLGLKGHYFVTTKYYRNSLGSAFYNERTIPLLYEAIELGHTVGSHSVSHSDLMGNSQFPFGYLGEYTEATYDPGDDFYTKGAVVAELEISKHILERDLDGLDLQINSLRTGHLTHHNRLVEGLQICGYEYSSYATAAFFLTNYPFFSKYNRQSSSPISTVIEMPLDISDVFYEFTIAPENIELVAKIWDTAVTKYAANYASSVLLIHPNRQFKCYGQKLLIDGLNEGIKLYNFIDYGEFWRSRNKLEFNWVIEDSKIKIQLNNDLADIHPDLSFLVQTKETIDSVIVFDKNNNRLTNLSGNLTSWYDGRYIVRLNTTTLVVEPKEVPIPTNTVKREIIQIQDKFTLYPNPASLDICIDLKEPFITKRIKIYNMLGRTVYTGNELCINISSLSKGYYILHIEGLGMQKFLKE